MRYLDILNAQNFIYSLRYKTEDILTCPILYSIILHLVIYQLVD